MKKVLTIILLSLIMIPNFTLDKAPKMLPELITKYKPNWIMGVPNFLQILMNYEKTE